jgi:hypothetical protein
MRRFILSAVVLAGLLATTQPVFAEPPAATATDHTQAVATVTTAPGPPTSTWSSPAVPPEPDGSGDNTVPAGPGWG